MSDLPTQKPRLRSIQQVEAEEAAFTALRVPSEIPMTSHSGTVEDERPYLWVYESPGHFDPQSGGEPPYTDFSDVEKPGYFPLYRHPSRPVEADSDTLIDRNEEDVKRLLARPVEAGELVPVGWPGRQFCEVAERNVTELAKWVKGKDDKQVASDAGLALRTLLASLTSLQARVEELERDLKAEADHRQRLQGALMFWMPGVRPETDEGLERSAGDDAYLLAGFNGPDPETCWGDETLARLQEAEKALEPGFMTANSDGQNGRYEIVIKFRDLASMQAAHGALVGLRAALKGEA